ncbi:MAG: hypothetical protein SH859_13935 [Hyphomicrobium aestuarii]|nr:hypothetical protein [Hyphomicrobium aestuarii]
MRTLLISYDLARPHRNKHVLAQEIMGLGGRWARPLECTWYVTTDRDEIEVEARLSGLLDSDDGLLIQAVSEEAVLSNTQMRWFRQRRADVGSAETTNIIAFPLIGPVPAQAEFPFPHSSGTTETSSAAA